MRANFFLPALPRNPLLRAVVLAGAAIVVLALLALGLVVGIGVVAVAAVALAIRGWRLRHMRRRANPSVIEGEYTVVPSHARERLPRPE